VTAEFPAILFSPLKSEKYFPNRRLPQRWRWFFSAPVLAAAVFFCANANAADQIARINPRAVLVKSFAGWGTSLCWWAHVLGGSTNREAYADLAFKDLQLNIVRYNIGGGEDPAHPERMQPRARIPGFEPKPGVWDWQADANQRWFLRAAVARGADHVVAFANSPPYWMTVSGSVTGSKDGTQNNLRTEYEQAFAQYLVTVVRELTARDGVTFNLLTPMNEPAANWWKFDGHQEGDHMSPDQEERMINLLYPLLRENHLRTGLEATEDNDERHVVTTVESYSAVTRQKLAWLASHTYSAKVPDQLRSLAVSEGKPLWISEYGDGGRNGLSMARRIRDDIAETHASAWIYWQFAEPDSNWGLVQYHWGETNPPFHFNRKFFVLSQFTRFVRPGDQIIDSGDPDSLAAYNRRQHRLVIVSVNDRDEPADKHFDFSAFATSGAPALGYRTSAHEDRASLPPQPLMQNQFSTTLPAQSVTTWVIHGAAR
jgi:O-glycosyl hydrolase